MRLEENHENWLKFANDYWEIDNGLSAVELGKDMIMKHVKKARDTVYGYSGELDETLAHADKVIEATDRENLKDTVDSLCDLGYSDDVTHSLKNTTLGVIYKTTGTKPAPFLGSGVKIAPGVNRSPVSFNGQKIRRTAGPVKAFNKSVDSTSVMADSVNINSKAAAILREAMARKADDGRVVNPTRAASTLKTTPISKGTEMDKATYDNEETWTHMVKQEAAGRMKGDSIPSQKTVAIPELRLKDFNDTRERLPPEFRNPKEIPNVVGMTLTDLPKPPDIVPQIHDPVSMAALTLKNHQMQQRQWNANLQSPKKPKQGFASINGAI